MLALSLRAACKGTDAELGFLTRGEGMRGVDLPVWQMQSPHYFPGEFTLRKLTRKGRKSVLQASIEKHAIDVVLPLLDLQQPVRNAAVIGWIPDFQATYLPQFFSDEERNHHHGMVRRLSCNATRLLLSSNDALGHLSSTVPAALSRARAIPFPSLFAFEPPATSVEDVCGKYHLPGKFAMIANQFWNHKNHLVVIEALRELKKKGLHVPLVCTGLPLDHRDSANRPLSILLQAVAESGLHQDVHILGAVPFADLVSLMRTAAVIIQPSRFEGWSTVVQDALALGRPLFCSDIPVHREQAPTCLGHFGTDDPSALASLLENHWMSLVAGPDLKAETAALEKEQSFASNHGAQLLAFCRDAATGIHS